MQNKAREFGLFIDGLRIERNISREDLCDNIMSLSQYKRYLRGDTSIPNEKLVQLADRLKFRIMDIYSLFGKKHNEEYMKIWKIFNLIKNNEYKIALELAQSLQNDVIISQYNKLFYDYCMIRIQHSLKMVSDIHVLSLYSELINYPECANNDSFNIVEISALIGIVKVSANVGNFDAMNLLYKILSSKEFAFSTLGDSSFLPSIYSSLSGVFGIQEEYEKLLNISRIGIEYCLRYETSNALAHLYYYRSLALLNLNRIEESLESSKKCFMQLFIEGKTEKFNHFKSVFEKDFDMKLEDLIDL